jgi:hypothetical protein
MDGRLLDSCGTGFDPRKMEWRDMKEFFHTWALGFINPSRFVEALRGKPAPGWGVAAQSLRAILDALLLYLPLALLGRQPSFPSWFTVLPTEQYYAGAILLAPVFLLCQWLLLSAMLHVALRLLGKRSDIDQILNLTGMTALVIGAFLLAWDWIFIALNLGGATLLGFSHLVVDLWAVTLTVVGLKRMLDIPVPLGLALNLLWLAVGVPLAMVFMRPPV